MNEYLDKREKEMEECTHLFVKLREGEDYYGFHSSDCGHDPCIVKCVKCGLTNKYTKLSDKYLKLIKYMYPLQGCLIDLNNKEFRKQYSHGWRRAGKSFDESVFNLISDEVFDDEHPELLYKMAKIMFPEGNNNDIFNVMKELKCEDEIVMVLRK
jgi:hypothetical protein